MENNMPILPYDSCDVKNTHEDKTLEELLKEGATKIAQAVVNNLDGGFLEPRELKDSASTLNMLTTIASGDYSEESNRDIIDVIAELADDV